MRKPIFAASIAALALTLAAHADTLNVNGTFVSGATLTGTLTLDTTTHLFSAANLSVAGYSASFTNTPTSQVPGAGDFTLVLISKTSTQTATLDLLLPTTSLTGYTGSSLCSVALPCGAAQDASSISINYGLFSIVDTLASGSVASSTVTPEPSTLALLGTGLLGAVGTLRRKLLHP